MRQRFGVLDKIQHKDLIPERMKTDEVSIRTVLALCLRYFPTAVREGREPQRKRVVALRKQRSEFWKAE